MGWEVGGRFMREGIYAYLRLIHVAVWQKPTQHCKAIILQLKINKFLKLSLCHYLSNHKDFGFGFGVPLKILFMFFQLQLVAERLKRLPAMLETWV